MKPLISLQLWSVQENCAKHFEETLKEIKSYDYDGIEFAGYYGNKPQEIKRILEDLSLRVSSSHVSFEELCDNFEEVVDYEKKIGNNTIIVPYIGAMSLEEWEGKIATLKDLSGKLKKEGIVLGYHNHAHEIVDIPNVNILEKMIELIPDIQLEIDTFWLSFAGVEVIPWLNKHKANIKWLHIKDMNDESRESTEIASGVLPIKEYLNWAKENGLEWVVIEQEHFKEHPPIKSAKLNVNALRKIS